MKPNFESVYAAGNNSFLVRKFEEKKFSAPYHFHPEYELTLILHGYGKRYVGTHMNDFIPGDFVLLGAHLPHCWKTDNAGMEENCSSIVIQFRKDFLGAGFLSLPETHGIAKLLSNSSHGIQFTGDTETWKQKVIAILREKDGFKKMLLLLELLHQLSGEKACRLLSKQYAYSQLSATGQERMNAVMAYIVDNFQSAITLAGAASAANMTPQAFCKYFKKITRKTFIEAVTDYRIDFAVRQLVHTSKPVAQIGFDSGFNDISNFHKTFKARLQLSPLGYRNNFSNISISNPVSKNMI